MKQKCTENPTKFADNFPKNEFSRNLSKMNFQGFLMILKFSENRPKSHRAFPEKNASRDLPKTFSPFF